MITLEPASPDHIGILAATMRECDVIEVGALGRSPRQALDHALSSSMWALTALEDGKPVAMLGVTPISMMESKGIPWMLGSDRIYDNARALVELGAPVVDAMRETFRTLENVVSVRNRRAQRFLRHWGWRISEDVAVIGGVEFVRFFDV